MLRSQIVMLLDAAKGHRNSRETDMRHTVFQPTVALLVLAMALQGGTTAPPVVAEQLISQQMVHDWLPWPDFILPGHPLIRVVEQILAGDWQKQPPWKLPMLVNALQKDVMQCTITAYCSQCPDGGGKRTRWGSPVRRGICAADAAYWGPGSVIWVGPPISEVLIVEDTGSAIKGPNRFDVCMEGCHEMCERIGKRQSSYVPLYWVPPRAAWGTKPPGWHPPVWALPVEPADYDG